MKSKAFSSVFVAIALTVAVLACVLPVEKLHIVIMVSRFFDAMIPVLAVGALLKYLLCCGTKTTS